MPRPPAALLPALTGVCLAVALAGCGPAAAPSVSAPGGPVATNLDLVAEGIAFQPTSLVAPADEPFAIRLENRDRSVPHDVDVRRPDGAVLVDNPPLSDVGEGTFVIPPLVAGGYTFVCSIHPIPAMTGTLTVR